MANTLFGTLKTNLLRLSNNQYNSNDSTKLSLAGNCINRALGIIQGEIKGHPFTLDTLNTVTATITTPFGTALSDTNIIEIISVSQRIDPRKMTWIPYEKYLSWMADPSLYAGTPSLYWTALQSLNGSGQNIWTLFFIPTPGSAITIYYDYVKNLQFSADGTGADAEYSPLPTVYDGWIYDEAKPFIYEMMDGKNQNVINSARAQAIESRRRYKSMILSPADGFSQVKSAREDGIALIKRVGTTPTP